MPDDTRRYDQADAQFRLLQSPRRIDELVARVEALEAAVLPTVLEPVKPPLLPSRYDAGRAPHGSRHQARG